MKLIAALGLFILALMSPLSLAGAQQTPICGPAAVVREYLESQNLTRSMAGALSDGDQLEAWEREDRIVFVIYIPNPAEPTRCMVGEIGVQRQGQKN